MPEIKGLEWTFDTVASTYDKFRPSYPDELYKMIFNYTSLNETCCAVEVGIGGGQATLPILKTGCNVTAVECGKEFSKLCKEKFREYPNFSVVTGKFEDVNFDNNSYNLVYSATAFHWIPEDVGYPKVFSILKRGGVFARFANHPYPCKDNPPLFDKIQEIYAEYYPDKKGKSRTEYSGAQAGQIAKIAENYGFTNIKFAMFYRTRTFSANEYCKLLGTYSDHIAIEENTRREFLAEIERAINAHGGTLNVFDTVDLQLARKP